MKHHRSFEIWVERTSHTRVSDSVSWHPVHDNDLPPMSPLHTILDSMNDFTAAISEYSKVPAPLRDKASLPVTNIAAVHETIRQ